MTVSQATTVVRVNRSVPSADEILVLLKAHGDRVTAARRAVVDALVAGDHHVTAEQIVARVAERDAERDTDTGGARARRDADAHRATVYRTLDRLEELGVITHVHLGHGPSTFHLEDRPHHHAVCSSCGAVVEVPVDALVDVADQLRAEHGFQLHTQHFALSGRCRACA
jgi:Fur family ferric uptake transcriptional regulator